MFFEMEKKNAGVTKMVLILLSCYLEMHCGFKRLGTGGTPSLARGRIELVFERHPLVLA